MRLIDADALKRDLVQDYVYVAANMVDEQPTVDAEPVRHGYWEKTEFNGYLRCSECRDCFIEDGWIEEKKWRWCPHCGTRMDGDTDDE